MEKRYIRYLIPLVLIVLLVMLPRQTCRSDSPKTHPPGVAGSFYPSDPKVLAQFIYEFTYPVAGACYAQLKGRKYTRVVVMAPSHFVGFPFGSIYDGDAYATPLGTIPIDKAFRAKLVHLSSALQTSDRGYTPVQEPTSGQMLNEHAMEVQLPFLQRTLHDFKLVPIVIGDEDYSLCRGVGVALAKALQEEPAEQRAQTLIVISSDLSHYHPYDDAVRIDHQTLQAIEEWDYLSLWRNFVTRTWEACGAAPIVAGMIAAERLGATHAQVLKYLNSGDTTHDKSRVVGYGAVTITQAKPEAVKKSAEITLTGKEKAELLQIAHRSVETRIRERKIYLVGDTGFPHLAEARGAFVTLKERGELRGCIGYISPMKSLAETVRDVAAAAAAQDPRFEQVNASELPLLEYEISVMSPLRRVLDINQIKVGKHGLIIKKGNIEGILLPQVPVEEHWDRNTFIEQTCRKAGLPRQAWKDEDTDMFMFTALVFGEHMPAEPAADAQVRDRDQTRLPGPPAR
jgi:hypothetical protein